MNTTIEEALLLPNGFELHQAFISFFTVSAGVAYYRANEYGPDRFALIAKTLAQTFSVQLTSEEIEQTIIDFDEKSNISLAVIYEELAYISKRYEQYGRMIDEEMIMPSMADNYDGEQVNTLNSDNVKELDVVKGSLTFVFDKLPKWVQRILDVLMEVLKITRGAT